MEVHPKEPWENFNKRPEQREARKDEQRGDRDLKDILNKLMDAVLNPIGSMTRSSGILSGVTMTTKSTPPLT